MRTVITNAWLEFTPSKNFREAVAQGRASGRLSIRGKASVDGKEVTVVIHSAAPTDGLNVLSPVFTGSNEPVVTSVTLGNPDSDAIDSVRIDEAGVPLESLSDSEGNAAPATAVCCWSAPVKGRVEAELTGLVHRTGSKGPYVIAELAAPAEFFPRVSAFAGGVSLGSVKTAAPSAKALAAQEERRARQSKPAEVESVM